MKREDLFLTEEQCLHLQELGLDMSDACFCWYRGRFNNNDLNLTLYSKSLSDFLKKEKAEVIPTYTLEEIFKKLPNVKIKRGGIYSSYYPYADIGDDYVVYSSSGCIGEDGGHCIGYEKKRDTLMESAYNMLVWCLENKYL